MAGGTIAGLSVSKTKKELKDVFGNVGYCVYSKTGIKIESKKVTLPSDGIEFPVTVDTLSISQDDPTINHYKVVGMNTDWFATSTTGDFSVSMTVPSKASELLSIFFGSGNISAVTDSAATATWEGTAVSLEKNTIEGAILLVNESQDQIMIINGIQLWAKPLFDNSSTEPFAFGLTGAITVDDEGTESFVWLKKKKTT